MKRIALTALLGALVAFGAFCQNVGAAQPTPTISIENGFDSGYNINSNNTGSSYRMAVGFGLTDNLQAEFSFLSGGTNFDSYTLLGLNYALLSKAGMTLFVGKDTSGTTADVAGVGIWTLVFGRSVQGSLQTGLRIRVDYIAPVQNFNEGLVRVGMGVFVGM